LRRSFNFFYIKQQNLWNTIYSSNHVKFKNSARYAPCTCSSFIKQKCTHPEWSIYSSSHIHSTEEPLIHLTKTFYVLCVPSHNILIVRWWPRGLL
jgi:hypothetical protein